MPSYIVTCVYIYIHINQYVAHLSIVKLFYDRAMASQKEFKDDDIYDDPAVFSVGNVLCAKNG